MVPSRPIVVQIQGCYFSNLKTSRDFDIRLKFTNCSPDYKKTCTCQNKSSAEQHVSSCQSTIIFLDMEMVRDLCIYIYILLWNTTPWYCYLWEMQECIKTQKISYLKYVISNVYSKIQKYNPIYSIYRLFLFGPLFRLPKFKGWHHIYKSIIKFAYRINSFAVGARKSKWKWKNK